MQRLRPFQKIANIIIGFVCFYFSSIAAGVEIGQSAPAIDVQTWIQKPRSESVSWDDLRGRVVVLEFWAIGCAPCIAALPHLNELAQKFKDKSVQFISIGDDSESDIRRFLEDHRIDSWIGVDFGRKIQTRFGVDGWPRTLLVGKDGKIVADLYPDELTVEYIERALAGTPIPGPNEPGGVQRAGIVPGQHRLGKIPLFQAVIRPARMSNHVRVWGGNSMTLQPGTVETAILRGFRIGAHQLVIETELPNELFEFYFSVPIENADAYEPLVSAALRASFSLDVQREVRRTPTWELRCLDGDEPRLETAIESDHPGNYSWGSLKKENADMDFLIGGLEWALKTPVVDKTEIKGDFLVNLKWDQTKPGTADPKLVKEALESQMNLRLVAVDETNDVVVVRTVK